MHADTVAEGTPFSSLPTEQHQQAASGNVVRPGRVVGPLLLFVGSCLLGGATLLHFTKYDKTLTGLSISGLKLPTTPQAEAKKSIHGLSERLLDRPLRLLIGGDTVRTTLRNVGMTLDEEALHKEILSIGHSGDPLWDLLTRLRVERSGLDLPAPFAIDREKALDFLMELKDQVDRSATDARLDLEKHTIAKEKSGYLLRVYDSLVALEYAARSLSFRRPLGDKGEAPEIRLSVAETPPHVLAEGLKEINVSTVLGTWETHYSSIGLDSDRAYNLKVGADKLNGHIIKPGQVFSFNEVVGNRTEKEGYRVAPVIQGGELVDGLAGGMCQIASTLHAAAFFAGMEMLKATPHSRPSSYIPMGLDSTVVWPYVDLKLKNPYDFPLVLHYQVNQGSVKVEILGKERPYKVAYGREILSETPFGIQTRPDPTMPVTQKFIEQEGYPGYRIRKTRYLFTGKWNVKGTEAAPKGLVATKTWEMGYPATTQILRVGTGPANLKKKEVPSSHKIPPVPAWAKPVFYLVK